MKQYLMNVLIAIDQLGNALRGGDPDETLSAAAWRTSRNGKILGAIFRPLIDLLFLPLERDHCHKAYISEVVRRQLPKEYRVGK